jgi:hypothetical protein
MIKQMDMENMFMLMELDIQENGKMTYNTEKGKNILYKIFYQ